MLKSGRGLMQGDAAEEVIDSSQSRVYDGLKIPKESNVMWLPASLRTKLCENKPRNEHQLYDPLLPSDVVFWLFELRHCTHLYDSLYHSESINYRGDSSRTVKDHLEYLHDIPGFHNTDLHGDELKECRLSSLYNKTHVAAYFSLIPRSNSGFFVSDVQLIGLQNSDAKSHTLGLNSGFVENKSVDDIVEYQSQAGINDIVGINNEDFSHNTPSPPLLEGRKNILAWEANPLYRGVPTVLWPSETNSLMAKGGDAKLRKLSEEGEVVLSCVMDGVSAVQDVDRCSCSSGELCGVGNFPVDNNQVYEAAEQYDNVKNHHESEVDIYCVVHNICKDETDKINNLILQDERVTVRGLYCIQESPACSEESSVCCGDIQERNEDLVLNDNVSLDCSANLKNDNLTENGSVTVVALDIFVKEPVCEAIENVNSVGSATGSDNEITGSDNCACRESTTLKSEPANNILVEDYEVLLNHFQGIVVSLESMDSTSHPNTVCESQDDHTLNSIFVEVENLADEVLEECDSHFKIVKELPQKKSHVVSCTSSDLSDDVFLTSVGSECTDSEFNFLPEPRRSYSETRRDINTIFDNGVMPPVRPERKKLKRKLRTVQHTEDQLNQHNQLVNNDSLKIEIEKNVSISSQLLPVTAEHSDENNPEELLLLRKVSLSSKEKRSQQTLSFYEDADNCCGGDSEVHICNIVALTPGCGRHATLSGSEVLCTVLNSPLPSKLQQEISCTDMLNRLKPELLSDEYHSPHDLTEELSELLDVCVPQVKSIASCQFPPEDGEEINSEFLPPMQTDTKTLDNSVEGDVPEEGYFSVDSYTRSRKGSTSSDIAAWKLELQKSVLSWFDDESENEWFSSLDSEGRVYYFEEHSNESSWALPSTDAVSCIKAQDIPTYTSEIPRNENVKKKREQVLKSLDNDEDLQIRHKQVFTEDIAEEIRSHGRVSKSRSMVLFDPKHKSGFLKSSMTSEWPQLWKGDMGVLKEGQLNRTKITENGKKLRKNWSPAYVVLTELFLLIFKDNKAFAAMKSSSSFSGSNPAHPELCVDLNGALIEHASKESSRKNVFIISTVLGLQVLLQTDNTQLAEKWYEEIDRAIKNLPSGYDRCARPKLLKEKSEYFRPYSPDDGKKSTHMIERSKSVKVRNRDGSSEDLSTSADERQTKIRDRLKKFFHRRPTKELLMRKGIYKDEPVFGRHLADVCSNENPPIPRFVRLCIEAIERKEDNMKADGLYRASGNLSQVQKIRLQVDQNNLSVLEQEEDVHVLTGALKLFFRELKSPVIPFEFFNTALQASTNSNKKEKVHQFQMIIKKLPPENRCTLEFLLQHLLKVTKYHKANRMHISNLAIVFGPTLMWPEEESLNMAFDLMQQNLVIECFLQEFESIFR